MGTSREHHHEILYLGYIAVLWVLTIEFVDFTEYEERPTSMAQELLPKASETTIAAGRSDALPTNLKVFEWVVEWSRNSPTRRRGPRVPPVLSP